MTFEPRSWPSRCDDERRVSLNVWITSLIYLPLCHSFLSFHHRDLEWISPPPPLPPPPLDDGGGRGLGARCPAAAPPSHPRNVSLFLNVSKKHFTRRPIECANAAIRTTDTAREHLSRRRSQLRGPEGKDRCQSSTMGTRTGVDGVGWRRGLALSTDGCFDHASSAFCATHLQIRGVKLRYYDFPSISF